MRTIIIHHVQEMWDAGLLQRGTDFETQIEKVFQHLNDNQYDQVIVTNFEAGFDLEDSQRILQEFCPAVYDYGYGWERENIEEYGGVEGINFCKGGNHSEVVLIDSWMQELRGEIFLCGAFDGECIEDMEIALEAAGKEFTRIEELIV